MGYGDKTQCPRKKLRSKARINLEYYITESEFRTLRSKRKSFNDICELIGFPSNSKTLYKYVLDEGWSVGEKVTGKGKVTTVNEDFFKNWTRESSWVYGWLMTDGSVSKKSGQIRLMLKRHDRDVLVKIRDVMEFSGRIYDGEHSDGRMYSYLRICRHEMVSDLIKLGMDVENKTFNTTVPQLPEDLFADFLRGVTEGDGSLKHGTKWNDLTVSLCSATYQFLENIQRNLTALDIQTTLKTHIAGKSGRKNSLYTLTTKSNADALRWCLLMYRGTTEEMRLSRKYGIFTNYVRGYYNRNRRSMACIDLIEEIKRTIPECFDTPKTDEAVA